MTTPLTDAQRRQLIAERQKTSATWAIIHILGSLKLAMLLLFTIALAIAIATVAESRFDTAVAHHYFYQAFWFNCWLVVLGINLACAALTRWPWQRKHLGFVITHLGIITLLFGAMFGRLNGFEAFLTLHKDQPQKRLITRETILTVQSARDGGLDRMLFPVEIHPPSEADARQLPLPDTALRLKVDGYSTQMVEVKDIIPSPTPTSPAGVALEFHSNMMGQTIPIGLLLQPEAAATFDFFGLARVRFLAKLPDPADDKKKAPAKPLIETHVVLAAAPDQPIIHTGEKTPSGYRLFLGAENPPATNDVPVEKIKFVVVLRTPTGEEQSWPLDTVLGKTVTLRDGASKMIVANFWADFAMREGKPVSLTPQPNNPALLVHLQILPGAAPASARPVLNLAPLGNDRLAYQLTRAGKPYAQGNVKTGDSFPLGWADWQATITALQPHAEIRPRYAPSAPAKKTEASADAPMAMPGSNLPGIRARLVAPDGRESDPRWIASGTSQVLTLGNEVIRVGFGLRPIALPFSITLEKFEVPRDEGTDTPANFISTLRFDDPAMTTPRHDTAMMNTPAMHPGGFWRSLLGWNYKFSQAQWNPQDLDETTLQVLYDPGWPFKWTGSLMICLGIAVMFYFKDAKRPQQT